ncbi:hypothetical protein BKA83DRAFT_4343518 [Pisolithus microcarpus]|nr:hypothetical protein BKA83DRAFT_4343518 [Pisolithus microcarpus]
MQARRGQRANGHALVPAHSDAKNARNPPPRGRARGREGRWQPPRTNLTASRQVNQLEYIPSVSRSSGIDKDGDSLKDFRMQEAYWEFIDGKLTAVWEEYLNQPVCQNESAKRKRVENQTNVLILFRKLREGLISSGRSDQFSLQVYENVTYLSIMFESSVGMLDTTSILSRLVPGMYTAVLQPTQPPQLSSSLPSASPALSSTQHGYHPPILMLLHTLILTHPSQRAYFDTLQSIPERILDRKSEMYGWIRAVARSLGRCDFVEFEKLTRGSDIFEFVTSVGDVKGVDSDLDPKSRLANSKPDSNLNSHSTSTVPSEHVLRSQRKPDLPKTALRVLLSRLRAKARDRAWVIFRSAYREMSEEDKLRRWLERYLALESVESASLEKMEECVLGMGKIALDDWMRERERDGHIRRKEGAAGKWVVCKVR